MIQLNRKQKTAFLTGEMNVKDLAAELIATYPVTEIAETLAELLTVVPVQPEKITITQEQFNTMFKIKGIASDGVSMERRGRPRKGEGEVK